MTSERQQELRPGVAALGDVGNSSETERERERERELKNLKTLKNEFIPLKNLKT